MRTAETTHSARGTVWLDVSQCPVRRVMNRTALCSKTAHVSLLGGYYGGQRGNAMEIFFARHILSSADS